MAKGQIRSNKETRKPKKEKAADESALRALGSQPKPGQRAPKKNCGKAIDSRLLCVVLRFEIQT